MTLSQQIFREYDIRGLADTELDNEVAHSIGRAYATTLKRVGGRRMVLARDARVHSDRIAEAFAEGVMATGVDVLDVGRAPTPVMYYGLFELEVDGGVIVTASHNTREFNGFKMCLGRDALFGEQIRTLYEMIQAKDFDTGSGQKSQDLSLSDRYVDRVKSAGEKLDGFELVIDAGNGMAGELAPRIFEELGCKLTKLYCEPDGTFPNHEADPTQPDNLKDLIAAMAANPSAQVGIGYDGDADRIGAVDSTGEILYGDQLLIVFAREVLSRGPETILCDVKCTGLLEQDVAKHGGRLVRWKTGHSLIKAKLKEEQAALAGEMSGHMFFADSYYGYDDAIYASVRLANIVARTGKTLTEMLSDLPTRVSTPELRITCSDDDKFKIVEAIGDALKSEYETLTLDGVRFSSDTGWGLVRPSNTGPVLVMRFEAESQEELTSLKAVLSRELQKHGLDALE